LLVYFLIILDFQTLYVLYVTYLLILYIFKFCATNKQISLENLFLEILNLFINVYLNKRVNIFDQQFFFFSLKMNYLKIVKILL
jgi:hypothetical protein